MNGRRVAPPLTEPFAPADVMMKLASQPLLTISLLLLPLLASLGPAWAQAEPVVVELMVNGRPADLAEPALLADGRLLVSGSVLAAEMGVTVESSTGGAWTVRTYGHEVTLRPDNKRYMADKQENLADVAPLYRGDDLFIPVQMLAAPLQITVTGGDGHWHLQTPAARVAGLRQGVHPDKVRFVVDLSNAVQFRWQDEPGRLVVEFPGGADAEGRRKLLRLHTFEDEFAPQITEIIEDGLTRLVFSHSSSKPVAVFTLSDPPRIVVDLFRDTDTTAPVKPPTEAGPEPPPVAGPWRRHQLTGSKGPVAGYSLVVDLPSGEYTWRPALAGQTIMRRAGVSRISRNNNAFAAINGGFFSVLGPPLGLVVVDGVWVKVPMYSRAVLGMTKDGQVSIRRADFNGRVDFEGLGSLPLEGLNEGHVDPNGVVAYNRFWGDCVQGAPGRTRLAIGADGVLAQVETNGNAVAIPPGGMVISGYGKRAATLAGICVGTKVALHLDTNPTWPGLWQAVGGGPLLVQDGRINVTAGEERFRSDVANGARPRSAVGLREDGKLLLLAVQDPGMTLNELANVMAKLGAREAMNLDGGGSTSFVVGGRLLNTPSDGCERGVSNALLILKK